MTGHTDQSGPLPFGVPPQIAGYRIQRVLGSGGMAVVYAAMQKQPRRTVALKVIKAGHSSESAFRRFKREIEILGKLNHPYIAQVYEAGNFDPGGGAEVMPYFVMEYISGARTILEHCAAEELDQRERLKLFVKVCAAVEHGHRNKVIHRDLKPGNILIDQSGEPKVIDFGVAHTTHADLSGQTMHTEAGKLVGTLQYMAPEQVDSNLVDLDPRCDVYALGVILHKLLTGKLPLNLEALPVYEAVRVIRETAPPRPSEIAPTVRGDLETIVLKAIEKERVRRYANAGSLGRDIVRYLANKPIHARRASVAHRLRLFARRHRSLIGMGIAVLTLLVVAGGIILFERRSSNLRHDQRLRELEAQREDITQFERERQAQRNGDVAASVSVPRKSIVLKQHTGRINGLQWLTGHGTPLLVSVADDRQLVGWDTVTGSVRFQLSPSERPLKLVSVSSGSGRLAVADAEGHVIVLEVVPEGEPAEVVRLNTGMAGLHCLAIDDRGQRLAWAGNDLTLRVHDIETAQRHTFRSVTGAFEQIGFAVDGAIAAATSSGPIEWWDVDGRHVIRLEGTGSPCRIVQFASNGATVLSITEQGTFCRWTAEHETPLDQISLLPRPLSTAISQTGETAIAVAPAEMVVWDLGTASRRGPSVPLSSEDSVTHAAINPEGSWAAIGQLNGDIRLVPLEP